MPTRSLTAAGLDNVICSEVTEEQAEKLLRVLLAPAEDQPRPCTALGAVGREASARSRRTGSRAIPSYARMYGDPRSAPPNIPSSVRAWGNGRETRTLAIFARRTPVTGITYAFSRQGRHRCLSGCGLDHTIAEAPKDEHFDIQVGIITLFMPFTSDGKEPDLTPFLR